MKILFDMRAVQVAQYRGIGNYSIHLVEILVKNHPTIEFEYLIDIDLPPLPKNIPQARTVFFDHLEYLYQSYDVYFITGFFSIFKSDDMRPYILPMEIRQRSRLVVGIVYDLIPLVFENHYLQNETIKRRYLSCLESANAMDHLFCISSATKADLLKYSKIQENRITVINGSGKIREDETLPLYDFRARANTLVYVGGDDYRKNLLVAAESFALAYFRKKIPTDSLLFIVCKIAESTKASITKIAKAHGAENHIIVPGYLPDETLSSLIQSAKATVFPSLYEGLGMPILESYYMGTPAFAGDNSSLRELTYPECRFDASDKESIALAYSRALSDKDLCEKSVVFGKEVLSRFSWKNSEGRVFKKICSLLHAEEMLTAFNKVAICTSLPPDNNGVAQFTAATFGKYPERYCFFSASNLSCAMTELARSRPENPATVFPFGRAISQNYLASARAQLYVIGNNRFSTPVFQEAMRWRESEIPRYVYFHDGNNTMTLYYYLGSDFQKMKALLLISYPERREELIGTTSVDDIYAYDIPCFLPILRLLNIDKVIVTTEKSKERVHEDLRGKMKTDVDVLPLPIQGISVDEPKRYFDDETLVIGHFGYPNPDKQLDLIIQAVRIIRKERKCALLLAGYGDLERVAEESRLGSAIHVVAGGSQEEFYASMAGVDIAVQLRYPYKGESSGAIHELLGLGKRVVATRGFIGSDISDLVIEVEPAISAEGLADILRSLDVGKRGEKDRASCALRRRSVESIVGRFERILNRGKDEGIA